MCISGAKTWGCNSKAILHSGGCLCVCLAVCLLSGRKWLVCLPSGRKWLNCVPSIGKEVARVPSIGNFPAGLCASYREFPCWLVCLLSGISLLGCVPTIGNFLAGLCAYYHCALPIGKFLARCLLSEVSFSGFDMTDDEVFDSRSPIGQRPSA